MLVKRQVILRPRFSTFIGAVNSPPSDSLLLNWFTAMSAYTVGTVFFHLLAILGLQTLLGIAIQTVCFAVISYLVP